MANLKKATIQATEGLDQKAIEVLFNPGEYTLEKSNQYQAVPLPGLPTPVIQFANGNGESLTMELLFDSYTDGDKEEVRKRLARLTGLMNVDRTLHAPPRVRFRWGRFSFDAVLERVSQKFTMFLEDGTPVRATASVTFKQYKTVTQQLQEIGYESADRSKRRYVEEGDQLWWIAAREYDDATQWRAIADANPRIRNPRVLPVGTELRIPPLVSLPASQRVRS